MNTSTNLAALVDAQDGQAFIKIGGEWRAITFEREATCTATVDVKPVVVMQPVTPVDGDAGRTGQMNMNVNPDWLLQMAEKEGNGILSVGGFLYSDPWTPFPKDGDEVEWVRHDDDYTAWVGTYKSGYFVGRNGRKHDPQDVSHFRYVCAQAAPVTPSPDVWHRRPAGGWSAETLPKQGARIVFAAWIADVKRVAMYVEPFHNSSRYLNGFSPENFLGWCDADEVVPSDIRALAPVDGWGTDAGREEESSNGE